MHFSAGSVKIAFTFKSFFKVKTLKILPYWSHSGLHKRRDVCKPWARATWKCFSNFLLTGCSSPGLLPGAVAESRAPPPFPILLVTAPCYSSRCSGKKPLELEANTVENYEEGNTGVAKRSPLGMQAERRERTVMNILYSSSYIWMMILYRENGVGGGYMRYI